MWLKFSNSVNPVSVSNGLHSLRNFNVDEETFLKDLANNDIQNVTYTLDPLLNETQDKILRKVISLSWKNRKGVILLNGEWNESLLTKLHNKEFFCPIFVSPNIPWNDFQAIQKISSSQAREKGKNLFHEFFNKKTFTKKTNISIAVISGLTIIFSYGYGAFTNEYREDSLYQYVSKAIIDSNYPCGHATYESDSSTFSSISRFNSAAVTAGNALYTNFDIGESTEIKKRTYVATYIQINNPDSLSFSFEGNDYFPSPLTLSDFGYSLDEDKPESAVYGKFYSISLYRYKYIERDWLVDSEFDAPIYLSQQTADQIIANSEAISSYDDLIGEAIEVDIENEGEVITLDCLVTNILLDKGHSSYLSAFYQDYCLIQISNFLNRDLFNYSFCFDPSTSYLNIKTIAKPTYIKNWNDGDTLEFFIRDQTSGKYVLDSKLSEDFSSLYDGKQDTVSSVVFLTIIIMLLIANASLIGFIFYKKIKKSREKPGTKITLFEPIEVFIFLITPVILIQGLIHIIQLFMKNSINSFYIFNYFGSNFSTIYLLVLGFLLVFALISFSGNNITNKKAPAVIEDDLYEIDI